MAAITNTDYEDAACELIVTRLKQINRSAYWLAKQLDVKEQQVYRWCRGHSAPSAANLLAVLDELDLEIKPKPKNRRRNT